MTVSMIEFGASWCPPCKIMAPILKELQDEGFDIKTIDTDKERVLADRYQVRSLPTFILLKNGQTVGRLIGARSKTDLLAALQSAESTEQ